MKTLKTALCVLVCFTTASAFSQKFEKVQPQLFAAYPGQISLPLNTLQRTMSYSEGQQVTINFTPDFHFTGTVLSNQKKYENLQVVMIKSASFGNAIFQLAQITNPDKSFSYTGRVINPDAGDGYVIKHDEKNNYGFSKFETKKILQPCSF